MPRNKRKERGRKFDTRLSLQEISKILELSPRQKISLMRYYKSKLKGGEHKSE